MRKPLFASLFAAVLLGSAGAQDQVDPSDKKTPKVIEIVICLDTSSSMNGLINAARQKIWAIVNDLALAKPTPKLRVSVISYGNSGYDKAAGWVRVDLDFTDDLDKVSQTLFSLRTGGGTELVGRVMQRALALSWSKEKGALKIMIVAGNESADQDTEVSFRDMCKQSIANGIMVNSIYCRRAEDVESEWKEMARLSDGRFAAIDQDNGTVTIATPYDSAIQRLSVDLNGTYVAFGKNGRAGSSNQVAQDSNASSLNADAAVQRGLAKAQVLYSCRWCLVDATRNKQVRLEDVKQADLPENMRSMSMTQRRAYIEEMQAKRAAIQQEIKKLNAKRASHISAEMKRRKLSEEDAFDAAVRSAIREQAKLKGFRW